MSNTFFCPQCRASLNPGTKIIMRVRRGTDRGLTLLSPKVGEYECILPKNLSINPGDDALFSCPVCGKDFTSPVDAKLSEVIMRTEEMGSVRVHFSRTWGEKATFVVSDSDVKSFGEDAEQYSSVNFFGAGRTDL